MTTTAQPTVVQATTAADFLGLIPALIGYTPTRSIVVVPFRGNHTAGAARFDLNEHTDPQALASTITGIVCRIPDARAVAVVIYTDQDGHTTRPIISALLDRATECGFGIKDALYVARDGWGSALAGDQPHPLAEINTALAAGRATTGDQHSGTEIPTPDEDRLEAVLAAFEDFGLADVAETDWVALAEVAATTPPEEIDPFDAASLIFALSRPSLRDIAIVQWSTDEQGGERAAEAQAGWEHGEEYPTDLASIMWGDAPRPDARRLQAALATVRHLTALAPEPLRAGLLATVAWLSWALGHSTHADAYAHQALAVEPGYGLSEIVASFVQAGHLPGWAFQR